MPFWIPLLGRCSGKNLSPRRLVGAGLGAMLALAGLGSPASATTYTAVDSAGLTSLLNNASVVRGDTIILNANTIYTAPGSGFILRAKGGTSGYVTIQSSNIASLPAAGVRAKPTDAANMPDIVSWGNNAPAIVTAAPPEVAGYYKFIGIEVYNGGTQTTLQDLIILGVNGLAQNSDSVIPHNIIFDRCYIHGQGMAPGTKQLNRAIGLHSKSTDIINCTISDVLSNAGQTQCIGGWNGPGPYLIDNNFLSCSGESILFGGASGFVVGQNPTGITVSRNHFYKNPAWKNVWIRPCNHFELKCGKNVIVRDNLMENCWAGQDGQFGVSINLKCDRKAAHGGGSPWFITEDVTIENNLIRDVGLGIQIAGSLNPDETNLFGQPKNVTIRNNLIYNVDGDVWGGNKGHLFYMNNGSPNVTIDHNTGFSTHMWMMPGDTNVAHNNFVFTNNIVMKGLYGVKGGNLSDGETSLVVYYPNIVFQKNAVMGGTLSVFDPDYLNGWNLSPFSNANLLVPPNWSTVLHDHANPGTDFSGWKVKGWNQATNYATYPYNNSATDGKDLGCDIDELNSKIAGCVSGVWSGGPPPPAGATYDGFNYTGSLNGQNGGSGYGANPWTAVSGQASPVIAAGSMAYNDGTRSLVTTGNKLQPAVNSRSTRNFPSPIATANTTQWVAFRANRTTAGFPTNHAGFSLFGGVDGTGAEIFLGKPASAPNWGMVAGGVTAYSPTGGVNAFLLYKLVFTSSSVTISMWVNPILVEGSLGTPQQTLTQPHSTSFVSSRISVGGNSSDYQFDEFRTGATFADVAPSVAPTAYDGINYTGNLNGKNGGFGFGSNAWAAVSGQNDPVLTLGSMAYTSSPDSLLTVGNKVQPGVTSRSTRNFASTIPTANTTQWVSFRINQTDSGTLPTNHAGFSLFSGLAGAGTEIFLGKPANATNWGMDHTGTIVQKTNPVTAQDRDALLVYKLEFTATTVTISMWVDPPLNESALGPAHAVLPPKAHSTGFGSLRLSIGANAVNYQFDEFRIGSSFASVVPMQ